MAGHSHRSTVKNGHKAFKSRHASKGSIKNRTKGKVEKELHNQKQKKGASKLGRKNMAKQLRENKILQTAENRKLFDGINGAERIVTVIPLTDDITADQIVNQLIDAARLEEDDDSMIQGPSVNSVRINKFKSNLKFIIPDINDFISILDAAKVADFVVFGLSGTSEIDQTHGEQIIRALELQGIGHVIGVVPNLSDVHPKDKFQQDVKQSLQSYFKHFFPTEEKIYNLENKSDATIAIRTLCQKFPKNITWRDSRGWLVADEISWENIDGNDGYLTVDGIVRGIGFNADRLVHIPGFGDFQVDKIEKLQKGGDLELFEADENQESLEELAPAEVSMDDWEELENYEDSNNNFITSEKKEPSYAIPKGKKLNLPNGTSEYQARWYLEDDLEEDDDIIEEEDEEAMDDVDDHYGDDMDIERDDITATDYQSEKFVELSAEEEERQLKSFREREAEDREFPDEVELHPKESGKERLHRYRGLKNLYNTVWNCDEYDPKAPSEWKRLLRISNFKGTKNRILKHSILESQVVAGYKVKLYIRAPQFIISKIPNIKETPFTIYGLLEHEHKLSVVNFSIQPWEDYENPIPSKDAIIVQYGPRRQVIRPIYSDATTTPNNVHRYQRFLHKDSIGIATAIAPVTFTNAPALFFKQSSEGSSNIEFVGSGSFLNAEHQRVLAKRAVLTGHPLKIHKNVMTIRYMFFNPEDVLHYKNVPLFTKSGRSGFIRESLGTHGYFKASFDNKITSQDVVAMSLYKRVWPKPSIMWSQ